MNMILRPFVILGAAIVFVFLAIAAALSESRQKRKLGTYYEGPLDNFDDN